MVILRPRQGGFDISISTQTLMKSPPSIFDFSDEQTLPIPEQIPTATSWFIKPNGNVINLNPKKEPNQSKIPNMHSLFIALNRN